MYNQRESRASFKMRRNMELQEVYSWISDYKSLTEENRKYLNLPLLNAMLLRHDIKWKKQSISDLRVFNYHLFMKRLGAFAVQNNDQETFIDQKICPIKDHICTEITGFTTLGDGLKKAVHFSSQNCQTSFLYLELLYWLKRSQVSRIYYQEEIYQQFAALRKGYHYTPNQVYLDRYLQQQHEVEEALQYVKTLK